MPTVFASTPVEHLVEHSRFVGLALRLTCEEELAHCLSQTRDKYPGANHYTWAYRLGEWSARASDDGEPQGTAGLPMLHILERENWEQTLVIVARYFGGIKLGRGGLIRAYQHCSQLALSHVTPGRLTLVSNLQIEIDYSTFERARRAIESLALTSQLEFGASVTLTIDIETTRVEQLLALLNQSGREFWKLIASREAQLLLPNA